MRFTGRTRTNCRPRTRAKASAVVNVRELLSCKNRCTWELSTPARRASSRPERPHSRMARRRESLTVTIGTASGIPSNGPADESGPLGNRRTRPALILRCRVEGRPIRPGRRATWRGSQRPRRGRTLRGAGRGQLPGAVRRSSPAGSGGLVGGFTPPGLGLGGIRGIRAWARPWMITIMGDWRGGVMTRQPGRFVEASRFGPVGVRFNATRAVGSRWPGKQGPRLLAFPVVNRAVEAGSIIPYLLARAPDGQPISRTRGASRQ